MEVAEFLKEKIKVAVKNAYKIDLDQVHLEHPENIDFGDYSTNVAMRLAKDLKQSPVVIAKTVSYEMEQLSIDIKISADSIAVISKIEVAAPGFINIKLANQWLQSVLKDIYDDKHSYGSTNIGTNKRIALEHSNVNPNKAAHIGHLRNACLGQFIEKAYEFLGYQAEVQYYTNDVGVQVATSSMGMDYVKDLLPEQYKKFDHYAWDVYSKMESAILDDPKLQKDREALMIALDDPKSPQSIKQRNLADQILHAQLETFQNLGIDYDVIIHESDILALNLWKKAWEYLKDNKNVYFSKDGKSAGCWLIKVKEGTSSPSQEDIEEDKILIRSNGVPTYTAKDIAYHMWKFGLLDVDFFYRTVDYNTQSKRLYETVSSPDLSNVSDVVSFTKVDLVYDVIGGEQTYAMDVVKKSLGYLGFAKKAENMRHINYGFVYLSPDTASALGIDTSDGKDRYGMSGRKGWGIKIDDFINMVDAKLTTDYGASDSVVSVRNGAIKFEILKYNTFVDIVFDLKTALNLKGFSGPYVQYTYARAKSVLAKCDFEYDKHLTINDVVFGNYTNFKNEELALLKMLYRFPEIVLAAATEFAPSTLCTYLFEVAKLFNNFYANVPVKAAETVKAQEFRLLLTFCTATVLKNGLFLLGIDAVEHM